MTDRELQERLQAWYSGEVPDSERAPAELRERIAAIPASYPAPVRPIARRRDLRLLAVAAILLVAGGLAAGAGLVSLPSVVRPAPSEALVVTPAPSPSATPTETASPPPPPKAWVTGQELMDALSSGYGYQWSPIGGPSVTSFQSAPIVVEPPFDGPAKVSLSANTNTVAEVGLHAGRIAQALAPDAAPWIAESITQGLGADWGSFVTTPAFGVDFAVFHEKVMVTSTGGQVDITFLDPPVFGHGPLGVTFLLPPPPPPVRTNPVEPGDVVYADSGLIRVANPDGTDAGTLLGGTYSVARVLGWSPDGSRLFYLGAGDTIMSTDAIGSEPTLIGRSDRPQDRCRQLSDPALEAKCVADLAGVSNRELCPAATVGETCEANVDEVLLSPDGTHLAYPIDDGSGRYVVGLLDIATGQVTRIAFDAEKRPGGPACEGPLGGDAQLQWSPDGTRFVFGKSFGPKVDGWCQGAVLTVDVDGTDFRRLTSTKVHPIDPSWSPDGSTIVFSSRTPRSAWDGKTDATRIQIDTDIYSVRPDGSGLTALTSDGVSISPFWTRDGRIVFIHIDPEAPAELWIMDADGANRTRLGTTVAAQTAAGCTACPYWPSGTSPFQNDGPLLRFWRPGQP